jgi:integrase
MRQKLTPAFVLKAPIPPAGDRVFYWDRDLRGFGLQVTTAGHRSFVVQYRHGRTSRRMAIDRVLTLDQARKRARVLLGQVANGADPLAERRKAAAAAGNTLRSICEEYLGREAKRKDGKLRSLDQRRAMLERLVYPHPIAARPIDDIKRSDLVRLLDKVDDERGASMADHVLAILRRIMVWHMSRSDDFRSPIVRGMARTSPKKRARERTLTDEELRAIWRTADDLRTPFARMLQFILLTAVRRNEAARMDRSEISGTEWVIPAARFKGKRDFLVPLTPAALVVLGALPVIGNAEHGPVFTSDGMRPLGGFGKPKAAFDRLCGASGWTIHDLRRTARTLMSRAGVDKDHSERVLGHAIAGVRGVYDRHEFAVEKRRALEALAGLIARILDPQPNVVPMADHMISGQQAG